jgi:hypothetical protein
MQQDMEGIEQQHHLPGPPVEAFSNAGTLMTWLDKQPEEIKPS